ncbi:MAG: class III poly(R)-hydroxyalkanoic acid synthase subunit PhaC [Desulfovibrio sp.]|jgi:polyhydroxyalkanoate synthase|nr:class III poly(R)-hydroxyalkanoic acid synthase subunit PhaC [Desulfovibrio sp.]
MSKTGTIVSEAADAFKMYESAVGSAMTYGEKLLKGTEVFTKLDCDDINKTPKDLALRMDKVQIFHYRPMVKKPSSIPVLIVYALMNKQYIMDIQPDKSFVKKLLELGQDVYIVDWGYPTDADRYITTEDYIEGYLGDAVDFIREKHALPAINLLGKCQGGTFSAIYTSLHPEKIKNLVTIAAPFDFAIEDGLLFKWSKYINIDLLVDSFGVLPGDFLNNTFIMLSPYNLAVGKYINIVNSFDDPKALGEFLRMEKWLFDCPNQAGENYRTWMKDLWQENKLIKGEFVLGDKKIDLKNITVPVLNVYGLKDNLIPASSSKPLLSFIGSKDKEEASFPVGHAGIVAGTLSQKEIAPKIAAWLKERS